MQLNCSELIKERLQTDVSGDDSVDQESYVMCMCVDIICDDVMCVLMVYVMYVMDVDEYMFFMS